MNPMFPVLCHRTLNDLADGLIRVYIPVAIYRHTGSFSMVIFYALIYYSIQSIINLFLQRQYAARPMLFISVRIIPLLLLQLLLRTSGLLPWAYISLLGITMALSNAFYWVPLNHIFASALGEELGRSVGRFRSASIISKMIMPLVSGLLLSLSGFAAIIYLSSAVYIASLAVLWIFAGELPSRSERCERDCSMEVAIRVPRLSLPAYLLTYAVTGVCDTAEMLWPLFVYVNTLQYIDVGVVASLLQVGMILANCLVGRRTDSDTWRTPAIIALVGFSALWAIRPFFLQPVSLYAISGLLGFAAVFFNLPLFACFIGDSRGSTRLVQGLAYREVAIKSGGAMSLLVCLFMGSMIAPFLLASATAVLLMIPILKSRRSVPTQ